MRITSKLVLSAAVATTVASLFPASTRATDYTWNGPLGGTQSWNSAANWTPNTGFPSVAGDSANLSVGLTSNLSLNLGQHVTVGTLQLGGTGSAVTTNVGNGSTAFNVTLDNTTGVVNNPDGNLNASITSGGVVGSVNTISAPVVLVGSAASTTSTSNITNGSTNNLTLGKIIIDNNTTTTIGPPSTNAGLTNGVVRTLQNNLGAGKTLTIGAITSQFSIVPTPPSASTPPGTFGIANSLQLGNRTDTTFNVAEWGDIVVNGPITNGAPVVDGSGNTFNSNTVVIFGNAGANNANSIQTFTLTGPNTHAASRIFRANLVLGHDNALGTDAFSHAGGAASGSMGYNILSTNDARNIPNAFELARNVTFRGEHSLTWSGIITQSNTSALFNLLPAGKTLTLANDVEADDEGGSRTFTFDGPGNTLVTGAIRNSSLSQFADSGQGRYLKNGSGTLTTTGANTYAGITFVGGGVMQFEDAASYTSTSSIRAIEGGSVGALDGSTVAAFLGKIQAAPTASTGALALDANDAAVNLDFAAGNMSHANTVGMSIGANGDGVTYSGTITPAAGTYRLGGGTGTLTLQTANQLTSANSLIVANSGTVALNASNNYSGGTTIRGRYIVTNQQAAEANNGTGNFIPTGVFVAPTLSISTPAALGSSSNDAANLTISGGTLKYTGAAGNSTRLFTITPVGATLDASGTGAINFSNPGAIVSADVAGTITGNTTTGTSITGVNDISQLTVGMTVSGGDIPANTTITGFAVGLNNTTTPANATYTIRTSAGAVTPVTGQTLTFGAQNRGLNLTGTNAGNNTVAGQLGNSATGTLAVNKSGTGKWVLSNLSNNYTGGTNVSAGTLAVGRMHENNAVNITGGTLQILESSPGVSSGHPSGNNASVSKPSSLTIAAGGILDITNNDVILDYTGATPVATYEALVASGYNVTGDWQGDGIVSSIAANDGNYVVAIADNATLAAPFGTAQGGPLFAGQDVDLDTVLIKFTHRADVNLDGVITPDDSAIFGGNYDENQPAVWATGDMNYDGIFTPDDAAIFGGAYDESLSSLPEPASLALLGLAGLVTARRRHPRR